MKVGHREGTGGSGGPVGNRDGQVTFKHGLQNNDVCPKHGGAYVVRKGTNRCPKGRKAGVNCR